ncbi:MAG: recombinase RecT, partial [Thermoplasmata archaeon]|nr:recombinase RecT [Thermoplasmata archaeon]
MSGTDTPLAASATPTSMAAAPAVAESEMEVWKPAPEWSTKWRNLVLDLVDPERKLSDLETAYFFARAQKLGLDPLARQIFPIRVQGRIEPFVGIHGIRMLAERTGQRGSEKVIDWTYDKDRSRPYSVTVSVERLRGGRYCLYQFTALMGEFRPANPPEKSSWSTHPEMMLVKCATANAYRMAFP